MKYAYRLISICLFVGAVLGPQLGYQPPRDAAFFLLMIVAAACYGIWADVLEGREP